jgi:3-oxoacyl-[acyl-carrier protein] reductase
LNDASIAEGAEKEEGPNQDKDGQVVSVQDSINPGMVETEGVHAAGFIGSDFQKQFESQTPLGRIGQPNDIAPIAAFLASDDSGWLTGELLLASGGLR